MDITKPYFNRCIILLTAFTITAIPFLVKGSCHFPLTNEVVQNVCAFSKWLPWNCTCCGSDALHFNLAERRRGMYCEGVVTLQQCLKNCNFTETDDTDHGACGAHCLHKADDNTCSLHIRSTFALTTTLTSITSATTITIATVTNEIATSLSIGNLSVATETRSTTPVSTSKATPSISTTMTARGIDGLALGCMAVSYLLVSWLVSFMFLMNNKYLDGRLSTILSYSFKCILITLLN